MKKVLSSFVYAFIFCFWLSTAAALVKWLAGGRAELMKELFMFALNFFCWSFIAVLAVRVMIQLWIRHTYYSFSRTIAREGVTPEVLGSMKKWADKPRDPAERTDRQLLLGEALSEGCYFRRAFSVLSEIDTDLLSEQAKEEYYNVYVYTNLMMGDVASADRIYTAAKRYFDRARMRLSAMPVLHTLGVLSYAKGELVQAENYLNQALRNSYSKQSRCDCCIYLSLCYLKAGRIDLAINNAAEAAGQAVTYRQKHELLELRRRIEAACAE